jgi:hypothetical protein
MVVEAVVVAELMVTLMVLAAITAAAQAKILLRAVPCVLFGATTVRSLLLTLVTYE